jgi:mannitol/fructose-specific phosphotransferase system IIA component (Ntr-type)
VAVLDLGRYADPALVLRLDCQIDRPQVIAALVDRICAAGGPDLDGFLAAINHRELVATTAIGGGVAVPHARILGLRRCRMAIAAIPSGASWDAPDGKPVHLAVMLAVREEDHAEHLRLLAALATRLRDADRVRAVVAAESPTTALAALLA